MLSEAVAGGLVALVLTFALTTSGSLTTGCVLERSDRGTLFGLLREQRAFSQLC